MFSSSIFGFLFGIYGIIWLDQRIELGFITLDMRKYVTYFFIFHRFLLIGSDLLPSLDRCMAVVYPLKYHTRMSTKKALYVCGLWIVFCIAMAVLAWAIDVIPVDVQNMPMAPFLYLTSYKFVVMTTVPFLIIFGIVFSCDISVLIIAMRRRKRNEKGSPKNSSYQGPSFQTSLKCSIINEKGGSPKTSSIQTSVIKTTQSDFDFEKGTNSINMNMTIKHSNTLDDLKLTIRCLSLTTFFFISQLCTFLPGLIFMDDDDEVKMSEISQEILTFRVRLIIFTFYMLQFLKPIFFLTFDYKLRQNVFSR